MRKQNGTRDHGAQHAGIYIVEYGIKEFTTATKHLSPWIKLRLEAFSGLDFAIMLNIAELERETILREQRYGSPHLD